MTQIAPELNEFHAKNGWMFKRMDDGAVRLRTEHGAVTLTASEWSSVVLFVSALDQNGLTIQAVQALHQGNAHPDFPTFVQHHIDCEKAGEGMARLIRDMGLHNRYRPIGRDEVAQLVTAAKTWDEHQWPDL